MVGVFPRQAFENLQGIGDADFNKRLAILKKVTIFRYLSDKQHLELVREFVELPAMGGEEFVFRQGDRGDKFYIIKSGEVRAQKEAS